MILQPDALLLDEPTANLGPYNVGLIRRIVAPAQPRARHNHRARRTMCFRLGGWPRRVALMLDGRIVESADAESFFESPSDPRTAAFVAARWLPSQPFNSPGKERHMQRKLFVSLLFLIVLIALAAACQPVQPVEPTPAAAPEVPVPGSENRIVLATTTSTRFRPARRDPAHV